MSYLDPYITLLQSASTPTTTQFSNTLSQIASSGSTQNSTLTNILAPASSQTVSDLTTGGSNFLDSVVLSQLAPSAQQTNSGTLTQMYPTSILSTTPATSVASTASTTSVLAQLANAISTLLNTSPSDAPPPVSTDVTKSVTLPSLSAPVVAVTDPLLSSTVADSSVLSPADTTSTASLVKTDADDHDADDGVEHHHHDHGKHLGELKHHHEGNRLDHGDHDAQKSHGDCDGDH